MQSEEATTTTPATPKEKEEKTAADKSKNLATMPAAAGVATVCDRVATGTAAATHLLARADC